MYIVDWDFCTGVRASVTYTIIIQYYSCIHVTYECKFMAVIYFVVTYQGIGLGNLQKYKFDTSILLLAH